MHERRWRIHRLPLEVSSIMCRQVLTAKDLQVLILGIKISGENNGTFL